MNLFHLFAMFGLAFFIKESNGPFDVMSKIRGWLLSNEYVGVFFYKLFDCIFCVGFWSGMVIGLLNRQFSPILFAWGFAGAGFSMLVNLWIESIYPLQEASHPTEE